MIPTFVAAILLAIPGQAPPGKEEAEFAKVQQKKWNEFYAQQAASYEITLRSDRMKKLELKPEPVLYWSNPVRGGETNGSVFVWTCEGRAALVGTVFSYLARDVAGMRYIAHSFQSLSQEPLAGQRPGGSDWTVLQAGVQPRPIPGSPKPAATAALRLAQMRELAGEFSATTTLDGVEQELRLLSQPIHRNAKSVGEVLDGALFTFVTGTDPELMLVIEARGKEGATAWHYAAGRFTDLTLKLRHKQVELWTHEHRQRVEGRDDPYITFRTELRPRVME
jgi:hypothetical protein